MNSMGWVLLVFVASVVTIAVALNRGWASSLAMDLPNNRSLHSQPTPRVGGVLVMPWVLLAALVLTGDLGLVLLAASIVLVSFADDRFGVPVIARFIAHLVLSLVAVFHLAVDGLPLLILLALAITWMTNLYNFMDGADGLAGGMAVIGFSSYAVAALQSGDLSIAQFSLCIVGGALGFLIFNFPPARIFMGDAGAITLGFLAAVLGLAGWKSGAWTSWFPPLVFSPFIVDATVTLMRRTLRGECVWLAHREHSYQKLVRTGWSHRKTAFAEYGLMLTVSLLSLALLRSEGVVVVWALVLIAAAYAIIIVAIDVKWKAFELLSSK